MKVLVNPNLHHLQKKIKFHDQALVYFGKMVDNGVAMLNDHFAKINELLGKIDQQMEHLIDKL